MITKFFNKASTEGGQLYWPSNIEDQYDYLEMEILRFSQRNILKRDEARRLGRLQSPTPVPTSSVNSSLAGQVIPSTTQRSSSTRLQSKGKILFRSSR